MASKVIPKLNEGASIIKGDLKTSDQQTGTESGSTISIAVPGKSSGLKGVLTSSRGSGQAS